MIGSDEPAAVEAFAASRERFENVLAWLEGRQAGGLEHAELEAQLQADARELFRQMFQDHLDLRATREQRIEEVADADQVIHPSAEPGHARGLTTVFGQVRVTRIAYRAAGTHQPASQPTGNSTFPRRSTPTGCVVLRRSRAHVGRSRGRSRRSNGAPDSRSANGRSNNSPADPPSTPTASTASGNHRPAPAATRWCCPATAKAS